MRYLLLLPLWIAFPFLSENALPTPNQTASAPDCPGVETQKADGSLISYSPIEEPLYLARVIKGADTTFVTTIRVSGAKALKKPKRARLYFYNHKPVKLDGELDYHIQDGRYVYTYTALLDRGLLALLGAESVKALEIDDYKEEIVKKNSEKFSRYARCLY
ncbi:hypothetical protein [Telluribacter sp.]|jgi:hypothetical protein|uniref:hypothetical protein n=1 Tax=Telluribacter sp. TaxID=1978767 RepID=UPI002E15CB39|nr:hypothetical protein [Telluribacter sp.]